MTGAQNPTIDKHIIQSKKELLILDLSIPKNVNSNVKELNNVNLFHWDDLSQITDEILQKRKIEIQLAESIIWYLKTEFKS